MVEEPVEDGGGKSCVVIEDLRPVFEGAVGGDDQGSALVALTDDLEEEIGAEFIYGEITEFIKDEQRWREVFFQFGLEAIGCACGGEGVDGVDGC